LPAQQIAPVGRSERPGELHLDEEEQLLGHSCTVSFLSGCGSTTRPGRQGPFENDHREQRMSDASSVARNLRERLSGTTEERFGRALSDLLENPLLTGAIGRALDARERAAQAQEVAMGALNIPSAADIERLTRRVRSVSHRLEGIEDGVHRLDRALLPGAVEARLSAIEDQLGVLTRTLGTASRGEAKPRTGKARPRTSKAKPRTAKAKPSAANAKPSTAEAKPRTAKAKPGTGAANPGTS
jgi:hypothetical protein